MTKVYVSHSRDFYFRKELYKPLREIKGYELILPHEHSDELFSSKDFFRDGCDVLVVEASYKSTGMGIELGWADAFDVPIIILYKKGCKLASSVRAMSDRVIEYDSLEEMVGKLEEELERGCRSF